MINKFRGEHAFLSNFHPCQIEFCGLTFGSVEAAYQAAKTEDLTQRINFTMYDAKTSKKEGKKLKIRRDWHKIKLVIMHNLLLRKFEDPILLQKLLDTGEEELIEGNDWGDKFWGVCDGEGENQLGRLLMKIRLHYGLFE